MKNNRTYEERRAITLIIERDGGDIVRLIDVNYTITTVWISLSEMKHMIIRNTNRLTNYEKSELLSHSCCSLCAMSADLAGKHHGCAYCIDKKFCTDVKDKVCLDGKYGYLNIGLMSNGITRSEAIKVAEEIRDIFKNEEAQSEEKLPKEPNK